MPKASVQVTVDAAGFDGKGGFVTTGDRAWFTRGNAAYVVPQAAWSKIVKARKQGTAPTKKAPELEREPELLAAEREVRGQPSGWTACRSRTSPPT